MTPCYASAPWEFTPRDWWQIAKRWFVQINADNVTVAAAGVAFFSLVAIFPLLSAGLSLWGFIADPAEVRTLIDETTALLPSDSRVLIDQQVNAVLDAPRERLGFGIVIGLTLALYSAGAGIRALMRALNIAYGEVERRPIWKFYLTAFAFTAMLGALFATAFIAIVIIPATLAFTPFEILDATARQVARILPFVAVVLVFGAATFILYRFGPDRRPAKKRWLWPGAVLATVLWLAISYAFSAFVASFGDYNATYGSIASVIILLLWLYLTAFIVLLGAELNAEMERQTLCDTTRGPARPLGVRGASMADFLPSGLTPADVDVPVIPPVVRPRHIRGTDVPPEKVEAEQTADTVDDTLKT